MMQQAIALLAFMATSATFAQGKSIKSALELSNKPRMRGELRPITTADMQPENHIHAPLSLLAANDSQDAEQAWRTVRSYFGMEIFLEFDIGTPGQTLRILIDSGSDWFWVTTDLCRACGGVKRFDHRKSTTY